MIPRVESVVFLNRLGDVAPAYGFYGKTSPTRIPSVNVPFSAAIIQYGLVQRKRSFSGIFPMRV